MPISREEIEKILLNNSKILGEMPSEERVKRLAFMAGLKLNNWRTAKIMILPRGTRFFTMVNSNPDLKDPETVHHIFLYGYLDPILEKVFFLATVKEENLILITAPLE